MVLKRTVGRADSGRALRYYLNGELNISSRLLKKLKTNSLITVNGAVAYTNLILREGDVLSIDMDGISNPSETIIPEDVPIDVLYEDDYLIVINKQAGMIIHPSVVEGTGTVSNGLAHYFLRTGSNTKIHPISRLDRDTTGVILFAKGAYTADRLGSSLRAGEFKKEYLGVVAGAPDPPAGSIDLPLGRVEGSIMLRAVRCDGRAARTYYETVHASKGLSLLLLSPQTGRTHQLRVHLSAIGLPLLSDGLYGPRDQTHTGDEWKNLTQSPTEFERLHADQTAYQDKCRLIFRHSLHSYRLTFPHPYSKETLTVTGPPPADFANLLRHMGAGDNY